MSKRPLAIVTMVFNEPDFLPIWLRYYGAQVGLENCYIIDHGSTDGSTDGLEPANVIRIPRSPLNEEIRCKFVSDFSNSLFSWFNFVAYTDVDEILVADPNQFVNLIALTELTRKDVTTAFGLNLIHSLHDEWELKTLENISTQRKWVTPCGFMCKPLLVQRPIRWMPGFHYADDLTHFGDLFLIHLAYCDLDIAIRRQQKRLVAPRDIDTGGAQHGLPEQTIIEMMERTSELPRHINVELNSDCSYRIEFVRHMFATHTAGNCDGQIDANADWPIVWQLPERFSGVF